VTAISRSYDGKAAYAESVDAVRDDLEKRNSRMYMLEAELTQPPDIQSLKAGECLCSADGFDPSE
jgi:hypothetical protein